MKYVIIAVFVIIIFLLWWRKNWRSSFGEGVRRLRKNDLHGAHQNFLIALKKNNENWQISHYLGTTFNAIGNGVSRRDSIIYKKNAIFSFYEAMRKNPKQGMSYSMIEEILADDQNIEILKDLIPYTKDTIKDSTEEMKEQIKSINELIDLLIE